LGRLRFGAFIHLGHTLMALPIMSAERFSPLGIYNFQTQRLTFLFPDGRFHLFCDLVQVLLDLPNLKINFTVRQTAAAYWLFGHHCARTVQINLKAKSFPKTTH
jgi:hypothetical protein